MRADFVNTRRLTTLAMLAALSIVFVWLIHFPIFPAAPYLEYDPADIPIMIGTFAFGPLAGLLITVVASVIQGLTVSSGSGLYGIIMHIVATGTFVLVAGNLYRIRKTRARAAVMAVANLIVTPLFTGMPVSAVKNLLLPIIIPFNLIKAGANAAITFVLYKSVSRFIKGRAHDEEVVAR